MPKVVFLTTCLATSGPTMVACRMAEALHQRGLECAIWGLSTPEPNFEPATVVPVRSLGLRPEILSLSTTRRLAAELAVGPPDILHLHSFSTHVHGVRAARALAIPHLLVSFHDLRLSAHRARICGKLKDQVDLVFVLNETMRTLYQRRCGYEPEKLVVLPNAVDTRQFSPAPRDKALAEHYDLQPEHYLIGSVGGLNRNKGHRYLIQALAILSRRLPRARLVLVGEGRDRRRLERLAQRLHLEQRILFAGQQQGINRWMSLFDCYVQPSLIESDPLAVHEAMAMGLPIVATDRGGLPEILAEGEAGVLVSPAQPGALAEAIVNLAHDQEKAQALAQAARRRAVEHYDLADYGDKLWNVYQSLLA